MEEDLRPPGAEFETDDFEMKPAPAKPPEEKESSRSIISTVKSSRRRSPSPPRRNNSGRYRGRGSPSPPRRNRFRDYSPDRRRGPRRSPDRDRRRSRSPPPRRGGRYRGGRGRSNSRSISPIRPFRGTAGRWSPKKKPNSPASGNVTTQVPLPTNTTGGPQYGVMPPQIYGGEAYGPPVAYSQYGVPTPSQQVFAAQPNAYGATPAFNAAFPPPSAWGVNDAYAQQAWLHSAPVANPNQQMAQMQAISPASAPSTPLAVAAQLPPPMSVSQVAQNLNALPDAAPGTVDPSPVHDAVAQEAENQRDELKKQRTSYLKKTAVLKKELRMLKEQRRDFNAGGAPPSPTTKGFIDENEKLQSQIQKKISTIENVIDMLTGIIGDENLDKDVDEDNSNAADMMLLNTNDNLFQEQQLLQQQQQPQRQQSFEAGNNGATGRAKKKKKRSGGSTTSADSTNDSDNSSSSTTTSSSQSSSSSGNGDNSNVVAVRKVGGIAGDGIDDDDDTSSERLKHKAIESMKSKQNSKKIDANQTSRVRDDRQRSEEKKRFNYVFYDPEMHWCQTCDIFPKTAKDFLNHLHTKEHINRESMETPWHNDMVNDQYPTYENAPTKRTPIRGLTFFVPATAWFCKLCNIWMGDLHCASTHLKSQLHSNKYNVFLEKNPHFEVNWLADRQRVLNEKKTAPLPPQITSVSTTAAERSSHKRSKRDDDKNSSKKRSKKKASEKKEKKKKKRKQQRAKKRKRTAVNMASSSSTSSDSDTSSSSQDEGGDRPAIVEKPKKAHSPIVIPELNNPHPAAASIRVAMRKQEETARLDDEMALEAEAAPPPPPCITAAATTEQGDRSLLTGTVGPLGKWTVAQANALRPVTTAAATALEEENKRDDAIIQQWNVVQPVISESEKKLLEQLKGKLKQKPREESATVASGVAAAPVGDAVVAKRKRCDAEPDRRRRSRSPGPCFGGRGGARSSRSGGRLRGRSRSRSRGGWLGRRRRTRSRSRGGTRHSRSHDRRRRNSRSRSRSARRRSRSYDRRRRMSRSRSRTRSHTNSPARGRVEKAVVKHSEFRPRVPERDKESKKQLDAAAKDKRDAKKASKSANATSGAHGIAAAGKKLPFIGKMPVFKKQATGQAENGGSGFPSAEKRGDGDAYESAILGAAPPPPPPPVLAAGTAPMLQRAPAPTAVQIQMAMMEDVYGNAPPFHPDAGMMMDYDDLMPDPVQFVSLMGQAPPPPPLIDAAGKATRQMPIGSIVPSPGDDDDAGMLPPGIDEPESVEFMSKQQPAPETVKGSSSLPKDLEEALNIIFPGEKTADEEAEEAAEAERKLKAAAAGQTQIIVDEPVMQPEDLVKEGIHMVTIEETSLAAMDEASQLSMNEPLVFSKPAGGNQMGGTEPLTSTTNGAPTVTTEQQELSVAPIAAAAVESGNRTVVTPPQSPAVAITTNARQIDDAAMTIPMPTDIPMPSTLLSANHCAPPDVVTTQLPLNDHSAAHALVYDLDDIPQPPDSPTDSEKQRRQEELDDLAMLGIDADDVTAAQCM